MAFDEQRLKYLLRQFANSNATEEDIREMVQLLREDGNDDMGNVEWQRIWNEVHDASIGTTVTVRKMNWWRVAAAAVIILMIGTGAYYWNHTQQQKKNEVIASTEAQKAKVDL